MDDVPADVLPPEQVRDALGPLYGLADACDEEKLDSTARLIREAAGDAAENVTQLLAALKGELRGVTRERDRLRAAFAVNASDPGLAAVEANEELGEALTASRAENEALAAERDRLQQASRTLGTAVTRHGRTLMAAWIDLARGDPAAAQEILAQETENVLELHTWNGTETGSEWLRRTEAAGDDQ